MRVKHRFTNTGQGLLPALERQMIKETGDLSGLNERYVYRKIERDYSLVLSPNGAMQNIIAVLAAPNADRVSSFLSHP